MTMAGMGGLPPRRIDQVRQPGSGGGLAPSSSGVVQARLVIVSGASGGMFVYSGTPAVGNPPVFWATSGSADPYGNVLPSTTGIAGSGTFEAGDTIINENGIFVYSGEPAAGNLMIAVASTRGTDPYGNGYFEGMFFYGANSSYVGMADNGTEPAVFFGPPSVKHQTLVPEIFSYASNAGAANEYDALVMTSGKNGGDDAAIQLFAESADATVPANVVIEFGGTVFARITKTGLVLPGGNTPAAVSGSACLYGTTSGALNVVDGIDGASYNTERRSLYLNSDSGAINTTLSTIFSSLAGVRTYRFHAVLFLTANSTGAEFVASMAAPAGTSGEMSITVTRGSTFVGSVAGGINSNVGVAVSLSAASGYSVTIDGIMQLTTAGTLNLRVGSLTSSSIVINQWSMLDIMPV